jgi:hypothetical protein
VRLAGHAIVFEIITQSCDSRTADLANAPKTVFVAFLVQSKLFFGLQGRIRQKSDVGRAHMANLLKADN